MPWWIWLIHFHHSFLDTHDFSTGTLVLCWLNAVIKDMPIMTMILGRLCPLPAWSPDGHRIKTELDYGRGPEKTWVYGADAKCAMARNWPGAPPHSSIMPVDSCSLHELAASSVIGGSGFYHGIS